MSVLFHLLIDPSHLGPLAKQRIREKKHDGNKRNKKCVIQWRPLQFKIIDLNTDYRFGNCFLKGEMKLNGFCQRWVSAVHVFVWVCLPLSHLLFMLGLNAVPMHLIEIKLLLAYNSTFWDLIRVFDCNLLELTLQVKRFDIDNVIRVGDLLVRIL